jgi:uncharacterized protein YrzB (UPF0473 family)
LFAFVLVCAGVLVLQNRKDIPRGKFKTPYINSKFVMPAFIIIGLVFAFMFNKKTTMDFLTNEKQVNDVETIVTSLDKNQTKQVQTFLTSFKKEIETNDIEVILNEYTQDEVAYANIIKQLPIDDSLKYESGFGLFKHKIPMWIFLITLFFLTIWSNRQNLSLIPLLGLICCLYMMAQLSIWNWIYFTVWLLIGLVIYFGYSRKNSKLSV